MQGTPENIDLSKHIHRTVMQSTDEIIPCNFYCPNTEEVIENWIDLTGYGYTGFRHYIHHGQVQQLRYINNDN